MNFRSIIKKNLMHNFKKFTSYIFVNIFVVAVLFMYGSIFFNTNITEDPVLSPAMDYVNMGIVAIILFSIVFVSYTGIYFIKTRGRELGVYLTLGMTRNDLLKMIYIESFAIMIASIGLGVLTGLLFSKLFYSVFSSVLNVGDLYYIDYKTFLLSAGVFLVVYIFNVIFSTIFIKRTAITTIIKSDQTKGASKSRKWVGLIAIFLFIASLSLLYLIFTDSEWINIKNENITEVVFALIATSFISMYYVIAAGIDAVIFVIEKNKSFYNRNIIILSNLKHCLFSYKNTLYIVSLLVAMSIFFMGFGLVFYQYTSKTIDDYLPYDFMIESTEDINVISEEEIYQVVESNGGEISTFTTLPYATTEIYRELDSGEFIYYGTTAITVSESDFNKHTGLDVSVEPDELLIVSNQDPDIGTTPVDYDTLLSYEDWSSGHERAMKFRLESTGMEEFVQTLESDQVEYLAYEEENTKTLYYPFINSYGNAEYAGVMANVVDDSVYASLENAEYRVAQMFNLESGNDKEIYEALKDELRIRNDADETLWSSAEYQIDDKSQAEALKPICKEVSKEQTFNIMEVMLFTMTFISILFLVSSSVVLYYKIVNDVEYERKQIKLYKIIGLTRDECLSYLNKHIRIIFFIPLVFGGGLGMFYLYSTFQFSSMSLYLFVNILIMYLLFVLFNILFYFILRRSFVKNVGL